MLLFEFVLIFVAFLIQSLIFIKVYIYEAKHYFMIGKLKGLRSQLFHGNIEFPAHGHLIRYLKSVYFDVFSDLLDMKPQKKAEDVLKNPNFNLRQIIDKILLKN